MSMEIFRFIIAGIISAVLELIILMYLVNYPKLDYLSSNFLAFTITNIINYLLSRFWVFRHGKNRLFKEAFFFLIVVLLALLLNQFVFWIGVSVLKIDYKLSKIFAIGITVIFNFFSKKHIVFQPVL